MRPEEYVVTTTVRGRSRKVVWDTKEPFALDHPRQWVLERAKTGTLQIRNVKSAKGAPVQPFTVSSDIVNTGAAITLPDPSNEKKLTLNIQRIKPLRAAYLPTKTTGTMQGQYASAAQLFATFGVRRYLVDYQPIHDAYVGFLREKPVFTFFRGDGVNKIKPLLNDIRLKFKGKPTQALTPGQTVNVSDQDLANMMILRGTHWWRILPVTAPAALTEIERAIGDEETQWFKRIAKVLAILFFLFSITLAIWPNGAPEEKKEEPLPDLAKVQIKKPRVMMKTLPMPESGRAKAVGPKTPEPVAIPKPKPEKPKPPAPVPVAKQQPKPKKDTAAAAPARPVKATPVQGPDRGAQKAAKEAQAQAKLLRSSLGGLLKGGSPFGKADKSGTPRANSDDMFASGRGSKLGPTDVRPGSISGSGKGVAMTGGSGKGTDGVDYGTGAHGKVSGQGGSYVTMDAGDSAVDNSGLTKDEIGAVIKKHGAEVRYCYEAATLRKPGLEGKLMLNFTIGALGQVKTAGIESSTLGDQILEQCVLTRLKKWAFPKTRGGVDVGVSYPFVFKMLSKE